MFDMGSTHGTYVNKKPLTPKVRTELGVVRWRVLADE